MPKRDWPPEPWEAGEHEPGFGHVFAADGDELARTRGNLAYDATPGGTARRIAEVGNAMRGWSAPEGAVDRLLRAVAAMREEIEPSLDAVRAVDEAARAFSRVSEPAAAGEEEEHA